MFEGFVKGLAFPITADIDGLIKGLGQADVELSKTDKAFARGQQVIKGWATTFGLAMTGAGISILALSKSADTTNARLGVTALTIGSTTGEMRDLALETSDAGFRLDDVVATFELLGRAGVRGTDNIKGLANQFDMLGDSVGTSAAQVAQSMIPAMYAFDIPLENVGDHMDGVAYLINNSLVDFGDLSSVLATLGNTFNRLGFSLEDTEALLLAMTSAGIPASVAMRKLRSAISDYEQALKKAEDAAKDVVTAESRLTDSQKTLTRLERDYARALQEAGDTSEETARIELRYSDQMADAKKTLLNLEKDYQEALAEAQNTTKDVARLEKDRNKELTKEAKEKAKLEVEYAKDKEDLDREARLNWVDQSGNARKSADLEDRYAQRRADLAERALENTDQYNERLAEVTDTTEAIAAVEKRYADQKESANERITDQTSDYNKELIAALETSKATVAVQEAYADRFADTNAQIAAQREELAKLREEAAKPAPTKEELISGLGVTDIEYAAAQSKILTESAGAAEKYAAANEKAISASDRLASSMEKLTLQMGTAISPAQDLGSILSIGGPLIIGLAQLPDLIKGFGMAWQWLTPILSQAGAVLSGSLFAGIATGIALGLAGVWVMLKTGILQGFADLGKWFGSIMPGWVMDVLKIIAAPLGSLGAGIISLVSGDFGKIFDNMMKPFSMAAESLKRLTGGIINFTVPKMAAGGIVTSPTIAMLGEAGPEAIVPLSRGGGTTGGITITGNTFNVRNDQDIKLIAQELHTLITRENRGRGTT